MVNLDLKPQAKNVDNHFHKNLVISETRLFLQPLYYFYFIWLHFIFNAQMELKVRN